MNTTGNPILCPVWFSFFQKKFFWILNFKNKILLIPVMKIRLVWFGSSFLLARTETASEPVLELANEKP
jgi:hypothetical protein